MERAWGRNCSFENNISNFQDWNHLEESSIEAGFDIGKGERKEKKNVYYALLIGSSDDIANDM